MLHTDTPFASEGPPNKHYSDLVHSSFDGYLPFLCLTTPLQCGQHMKKVPSSGKRKVWGTRKQINANTICQTIAKSTSLTEDSISVKRKFSLSNGKETRWWFVISGDESTLATLEREWGVIQQKSNWKLLPCLVFDNSPDAQPVHESDSASPPLTQIPVSLSISAPCSLLNNPATPVVEPNGSSD